jgi:hypothetical protein
MTGPDHGNAGEIEQALRTALDRHAQRIDVAPDALTKIRARTRQRHRLHNRVHRGGFMLTLGTGTGVLAATVVFAFAGVTGGCGSRPVATSTPPVATAPAATTPATSPPPAHTVSVPVYYVGPGSRLYREYRTVSIAATDATDTSVAASVDLALRQSALDPDYHSGWPAGVSVRQVSVSAGVTTIDLHGATVNGGTAAANRASIQQLIWTATAYTGGTGVKLLFDGVERATLWATKQPVAGVLHRAPAVDTLASMWVIDPQQGAATGSPVTIKVAGIMFEGAMGVEIRKPDGSKIQKPIHLSAGSPAQGAGSVTVSLTPGTYTVVAYYKPLKNTSTVYGDDHVFTVK